MSYQPIRISHKKIIKIENLTAKGKSSIKDGILQSYTEESGKPSISSILIDFKEDIYFNSISFQAMNQSADYRPESFRFEISMDGKIWEPIIQDSNYHKTGKLDYIWKFSLAKCRFLKMVYRMVYFIQQNDYKLAFQNFQVSISGIENIQVSSEFDRLWVKENLTDDRKEYGWCSKEKESPAEEFILVDLGSINKVEEFRLFSADMDDFCFPHHFYVYYSEDEISWHQLLEESDFFSERATWYRWRFMPINMRFFKLVSLNSIASPTSQYISRIIELEIYASPDVLDFNKNRFTNEMPPYASILRSGLVRLAADGEVKEGTVVQSSDRRLRDATVEFKGIVELASDGEDKPNVVVQANDRRLKNATESNYGLARLAKNNENRPGLVIQSNDDRIRLATTDSIGIVELAEDGETRVGVVVQGNDKRLKNATTETYGLVVLSELGQDYHGKVVQANDPRLKNANTEHVGILRFAKNGEETDNAAVQGNDKRLKNATTETYGIIRLAKSGETKEGLVVQGNDRRLKYASEDEAGTIMFAPHNSKTNDKAVKADDPRLNDMRVAKPHTHDYAPIQHEYNSHTGLIRITGSSSSEFKGVVVPPQNHAIVFAKNESKAGSGLVGVGLDTGVVGFGENSGVTGYSSGVDEDSGAVQGFAKKGYGGVFVSHRNYAIYANGDGYSKKDISGSGKAIYAKGDSEFLGTFRVINSKGLDCIAKYFRTQQTDVISNGDLIAIGDKDSRVVKSKTAYSTKILGVSVQSACIELGQSMSINDHLLVALYGVVLIFVDASEGAIHPGDLLVSGLVSGHAIKGDSNKIKPGMIVAKALGECLKDRALIQAVLTI